MKKTLILLCGITTAMAFGCNCSISAGNGISVNGYTEDGIDFSEERSVGRFESFTSFIPANVYFVQAPEQKVLVEGKEEFVKKLIAEVQDKTLCLKLQKGNYNNLVLRVTVYSPFIEDIDTYGSGNIICGAVTMNGTDIKLSTSGSGDVVADSLFCKEVSLKTKGSGDISVAAARCEDLDASTFGSGDIRIGRADVGDEIELHTAGSGDISVNGRCRKVEAKTMGSGDISGALTYSVLEDKALGSGKVSFDSGSRQ